MNLQQLIENLIGVYTPLLDSNGQYIGGLTGMDIPYILRAILLVVAVWGFTLLLNSLTKALMNRR